MYLYLYLRTIITIDDLKQDVCDVSGGAPFFLSFGVNLAKSGDLPSEAFFSFLKFIFLVIHNKLSLMLIHLATSFLRPLAYSFSKSPRSLTNLSVEKCIYFMDKQIRLVSFKYFAQKSKPKQPTNKTFTFQASMKIVNPMLAQESQKNQSNENWSTNDG